MWLQAPISTWGRPEDEFPDLFLAYFDMRTSCPVSRTGLETLFQIRAIGLFIFGDCRPIFFQIEAIDIISDRESGQFLNL